VNPLSGKAATSPTKRTEDDGVSTYTYNNLNQLVTGSWSGTLSVFGWTQTENLDHVQVATGQQRGGPQKWDQWLS